MGVGRGTKLKVVFLMVARRATADAVGAVAARESWVVKQFPAQGHTFFGHGIVGRDVVFCGEIGRLS